ncbi:nucleoside triphosphate pyrophosphohydrolase family protein [soil metagenome]
MTLNEYQQKALLTAVYSDDTFKDLMHWVLGTVGEAGEIAEKLKKIIRDKESVVDEHDKQELMKEVGDVLWYLAVLSDHLGYELETVAKANNDKLLSRQSRNKIRGKGDNR